jgi:SAM-dependent methyltransferase
MGRIPAPGIQDLVYPWAAFTLSGLLDSHMDERLAKETECLIRSWMQHDPEMLNTYLVSGMEDPRINVQSILTRHFLIVALFDKRFEKLLEQELRFGLVMNWLRVLFEHIGGIEDLQAIRHALVTGADDAEGWAIPAFVSAAWRALPVPLDDLAVPDYLSPILDQRPSPNGQPSLDEQTLSTFQRLWAKVLESEPPGRLTVLEPACGSANDYRSLRACGLARLVDYAGLDLCPRNIENARKMFPDARFDQGNVFALPYPDSAFDVCIVHDLCEHLSLEGLDAALMEICRVTRRSLAISFFNLHEAEEHLVRPIGEYYWNTLSVPRLREQLERYGFEVQIIHLDTFLKWRFGCDQTHNKNAYTFFAERPPKATDSRP